MKEKTLKFRTVFTGRIIKVEVHDVEIEPGVRSTREIVRHAGASVVLAQLPDGRFVFVKQYRKPMEKHIVELVAGGLEKGETPRACAARELEEEIGYAAGKLVKLGVLYPTPGYTDEVLHVYYAKLKAARVKSYPDNDERIEVVFYSKREFERMIKSGRIKDAKTLAGWLLWKSARNG